MFTHKKAHTHAHIHMKNWRKTITNDNDETYIYFIIEIEPKKNISSVWLRGVANEMKVLVQTVSAPTVIISVIKKNC